MAPKWGSRLSHRVTLCVFLRQQETARVSEGSGANPGGLGGFGHGLVYQQNRNVVAHGVNAATLSAAQALATRREHQRLLADGTDQNIEQILGDHKFILTTANPFGGGCMSRKTAWLKVFGRAPEWCQSTLTRRFGRDCLSHSFSELDSDRIWFCLPDLAE